MDSVSCRARARADSRRERRFSVDVDAILSWGGVSQPVTIRNISNYGALLVGTWLPTVGERVTLIADGLEVCGTVIWEGPDRCGLLLRSAVDPVAIIGRSGEYGDERPAITLRRVGLNRYA